MFFHERKNYPAKIQHPESRKKKKHDDRFQTYILSVSIVRSDDDDRDGKKSTGM